MPDACQIFIQENVNAILGTLVILIDIAKQVIHQHQELACSEVTVLNPLAKK